MKDIKVRKNSIKAMQGFCEAVDKANIINDIKAKMYAISSDTHQLQLIKLHHLKLERFKSI